jgi:acetoin utilization deacetylase AcuC-like enzyme
MKVFFDIRQTVQCNDSDSPSAGKAVKVIESWKKIVPVDIQPVMCLYPCTIELAHDKQHIEDILLCKKKNGFDNDLPQVATSLLWNNGSFVDAAMHAAKFKWNTVSPTSGFHHAEYARSMGYCTFNGLCIAAAYAKNSFLVDKVAIIDSDMHYGNGTDDIIRKFDWKWINHYTFGGEVDQYVARAGKFDSVEYMDRFPITVAKTIADTDLIMYQAGADPHVDDPYGGALTTEQLRERDRIVFTLAKEFKIPVVWNLAGGYQRDFSKVLQIHDNTALMHHEVFGD